MLCTAYLRDADTVAEATISTAVTVVTIRELPEVSHEVQFRLRIHRGETVAVGPGKIALLEAIATTGSISAAARSLEMSYRRAWLLIDEMNKSMIRPAVGKAAGGAHGGGAFLTPAGEAMVKLYRSIEKKAHSAAAREIGAISRMLIK